MKSMQHIRDITKESVKLSGPYVQDSLLEDVGLSEDVYKRQPQGMLSAVIKEYFRDPEHAGGKKTVMISIMPCTAKKAEAVRPNSFTAVSYTHLDVYKRQQ